MSLEYVIQELEGRRLECEEGIKESQAKVRNAEAHLASVRISSQKMIEHYQQKIIDLNEALLILEEQRIPA